MGVVPDRTRAQLNGNKAGRLPAAERRQQLVSTAFEVFAAKGFHDASMNDIAEAAGVTKPVLYQHFGSKRELFLELLREGSRRLRDNVAKATATAASPRAQVEAGFGAFFRFVQEEQHAFALIFSGAIRSEPAFAEEVDRVEREMALAITELIQVEGMDQEHRRILAYGIVGIAEVAARHWVGRGFDTDADELAAQLAMLAWQGLRGARQVSG